jgi:large subunit ribosomal protein L15
MSHGDRRTRRLRGSRMHGFGNTQKHRGAGSRGGHGMAGGKKHKWVYVSKYMPGYFGQIGFKRHKSIVTNDTTMNVGQLSRNIESMVQQGLATGSKGSYEIDFAAAGYTKLLGAGKALAKFKVKVERCSEGARAKIEAAGGSVEVTKVEAAEEKAKEAPAKSAPAKKEAREKTPSKPAAPKKEAKKPKKKEAGD